MGSSSHSLLGCSWCWGQADLWGQQQPLRVMRLKPVLTPFPHLVKHSLFLLQVRTRPFSSRNLLRFLSHPAWLWPLLQLILLLSCQGGFSPQHPNLLFPVCKRESWQGLWSGPLGPGDGLLLVSLRGQWPGGAGLAGTVRCSQVHPGLLHGSGTGSRAPWASSCCVAVG